MGTFKDPRLVGSSSTVAQWPADEQLLEKAIIEYLGATADVPFTGRQVAKIDATSKVTDRLAYEGIANGVAGLGADGKVPVAQLPVTLEAADVYSAAQQSIPSGVLTVLTFDTVNYQLPTNNFWVVGAPDRFTVSNAGVYVVSATANLALMGGGGTYRQLRLLLGGIFRAGAVAPAGVGGTATYLCVSRVLYIPAGLIVQADFSHDAPTAQLTQGNACWMSIVRVR